jgi:hypothetical protein
MGMARDQERRPSTMKTAKPQAQRATAIRVPVEKEGRAGTVWVSDVEEDMMGGG